MEDSTPPNPESPRHSQPDEPRKLGYANTRTKLLRRLPIDPEKLRAMFTREQVFSAIKTLAWVLPLTVLIWVYAEREQVDRDQLTFPIRVVSTNPRRIVTLIRPSDGNVIAELSGPRVRLSEMRDFITPGPDSKPIEIKVSHPAGTHEILSADALNANGTFADNGITLRDCRPELLSIFVDEIVEREARVEAPAALTSIDGLPVFQPATVRISGPSFELNSLQKPDGSLVVYADLASSPVLSRPGQHELPDIPLLKIGGEHVTMGDVKRVNVQLKIRETNVTLEVKSIPVWVTLPPTISRDYYPKYDATLSNVTLIGPPDVIAMIERDDAKVRPKARVEIQPVDETAGIPISRRPVFDLPTGVTASQKDLEREITIELIRAQPAE